MSLCLLLLLALLGLAVLLYVLGYRNDGRRGRK